MPNALDKAPHLLVIELHERSAAADALSAAAVKAVEEAGATCERMVVKQAEDVVLAASHAGTSKDFDALIVLAELEGTKGKRRLVTNGLQQVALNQGLAIGQGFLIEGANDDPQIRGIAATDSALRLFAIKARFNPILNESQTL